MKNAHQLLEQFTAASFRDPRKAAEMFTEEGAFEMPYLESLGIPWRYAGRKEIEGSFTFVRGLYPDMDFHDFKVVCETPEVAVGKYEFTTRSSKTGRIIHQLFVGRLHADKGRLHSFASPSTSWSWALASFPNGLADYQVPEGRKA